VNDESLVRFPDYLLETHDQHTSERLIQKNYHFLDDSYAQELSTVSDIVVPGKDAFNDIIINIS
jgi:hypothetical protein